MDELNLASMLLSVPLVTAAVLGSVALGRLAAGVFFRSSRDSERPQKLHR